MEKTNKLKHLLKKIQIALSRSKLRNKVDLLVVSKKRSVEEITDIYNLGQRDFGENYVNDLLEKSEKLPMDINWYMIGHLQTNKCKKLLSIKNLKAIESVDSLKLASEINTQCEKLGRKIGIYIQINISKEASKSGISPDEVFTLFEEIAKQCPYVNVEGIMSLGTLGSTDEFKHMYEIKKTICEKYKRDLESFKISTGTSDDFEEAILNGSNEVRLGSIVFEY
jgi:pyridoxal phosphate enzyme (YggS family)